MTYSTAQKRRTFDKSLQSQDLGAGQKTILKGVNCCLGMVVFEMRFAALNKTDFLEIKGNDT